MKKTIQTDKNQRELNKLLSGRFPVSVEHEQLSNYIKQTVLFHWHPELEITVVLEGSLICQVNADSRRLDPGDGIFVNTNVLHAYFPANEKNCIYKAVRVEPSILAQPGSLIYDEYIAPILSSTHLAGIHLSSTVPWQKEIANALTTIASLDLSATLGTEIFILEQLIHIWGLLYTNTIRETEKLPQSAKDIPRMKQAMTFIQNHCHRHLTLSDIAASCSLSESECCRLFRRILNQSPVEYVISSRINKSLPLLAEGTRSITEVAGLTGFQSSSYFTETFRKLTGLTPTQYRKQLTRKPNP